MTKAVRRRIAVTLFNAGSLSVEKVRRVARGPYMEIYGWPLKNFDSWMTGNLRKFASALRS